MADLHYVLEVEPLDLGADVKAVGLDLMEVESREPAHGSDAAHIWAAALGALAGTEPWALDFFAHLDRVREYCRLHAIPFEEKSRAICLVIPAPPPEPSRTDRTIRRRNLWRARRRAADSGRRRRRRRTGPPRRGRVSRRISKLFVLRGLRFREWFPDAAHRKVVDQRGPPPREARRRGPARRSRPPAMYGIRYLGHSGYDTRGTIAGSLTVLTEILHRHLH